MRARKVATLAGSLMMVTFFQAALEACSSSSTAEKTSAGDSGVGSRVDAAGGDSGHGQQGDDGGSSDDGAADSGESDGGVTDDAGSDGAESMDGGVAANACPESNPTSPTLPNAVQINDATLSADAHWTASHVYLVLTSLSTDGFTLTIDPGTTVCLANGASIVVGGVNPGQININGTASKHVVFTAAVTDTDGPDWHGGLQLNQWMASTISYLDIFYGGPGGGSAAPAFDLPVTSGGSSGKALLIDHLYVGQLQTRGINIGTPDGVDPASNIHIAGFYPTDSSTPALGTVLDLEIRAAASFTSGNLVIDKANVPADAAYVMLETNVTPQNLDRNATLNDLGLPYRYSGDLGIYDDSGKNVDPILTINSGVTLALDGSIMLGDMTSDAMGDIQVKGTASSPVTLTSNQAAPAAGDWDGLFFVSADFGPAVSSIDHAVIQFAGTQNNGVSACGTERYGAITIDGTSTYAGPTITNTKISDSASDGIASASGMDGTQMTTDYTAASLGLSFANIAGTNVDTAACP